MDCEPKVIKLAEGGRFEIMLGLEYGEILLVDDAGRRACVSIDSDEAREIATALMEQAE